MNATNLATGNMFFFVTGGNLPAEMDFEGLKMTEEDKKLLLSCDVEGWKTVIPAIQKHFETFGTKLPAALKKQLKDLAARLG